MSFYRNSVKKNYSWVPPLIAGILFLIAILTPTATWSYSGVSWSWWMFNLSVMSVYGYDSISVFASELDFVIPAIITTLAILFCAINSLLLAFTTKRTGSNRRSFLSWSLISAGIAIGVMIYYINAMHAAFYNGLTIEGEVFPAGYPFWSIFSAGFGVILPFISAALCFIGIGVYHHFSKQEELMAQQYRSVQASTSTTMIKPQSISQPMDSHRLLFCPECGFKLMKPDAQFCTNCGFKF